MRYRNQSNSMFWIGGFVILLFVIITFINYSIQTHTETTTLTFVDKERLLVVSSGENGTSSKYENVAYTDDEVYSVQDSFWNWHFRARTVYAQIELGVPCQVTLSGYRMGYLSMQQNIIAVSCD